MSDSGSDEENEGVGGMKFAEGLAMGVWWYNVYKEGGSSQRTIPNVKEV